MGLSLDFIKTRALATNSAAAQVAASWTWQEKTVAQMQDAVTAIIGDNHASPRVVGQEESVSDKDQVMRDTRTAWDAGLDTLHRWTVQGVGMAKNKYRHDPAKLSQLENLTAEGNSRADMLTEALAWESAWENVAPAWVPMPANTLSTFHALREQCLEDLQKTYLTARTDWRTAANKLAEMGRAVEDTNEAWYEDATRAFPIGTPEGDMIRSLVPTTYNPAASAAPASPAAPNP